MPAGSVTSSVTLTVPRLTDDPAVASGCRTTLAEDVITQELTAWPGIEAVVIEQAIGQVMVVYIQAAG
jgi:hypothetical protein